MPARSFGTHPSPPISPVDEGKEKAKRRKPGTEHQLNAMEGTDLTGDPHGTAGPGRMLLVSCPPGLDIPHTARDLT